jgi:hypothetical protein
VQIEEAVHTGTAMAGLRRRARGPRWLLGALLLALPATGCGGEVPLISAAPVAHLPTGCVIADVSGSALRARAAYKQAFHELAVKVANENGRLCLVMASGNPLGESTVRTADLAPAHPDNSLLRPREIDQNVAQVDGQFAYLLRHPGVGARGSGLVEAAALAARGLEPDGDLIFLSDGVQDSAALNVHTADLSDAGIQRILDDLDRQRLLPDLTGVKVSFPLPFFHPPGSKEARRTPSAEQIEQRARIEAFWRAWALHVNADQPLGWGV